MFHIHGFDPKVLTDDQLFEKQLELTKRRLIASRFGKVDVAEQLQLMIQAVEFERRERMFNAVIGAHILNSSPVVVETDPDLKSQEDKTDEEEAPKVSKQQVKHMRRSIRTTKPTKPDGML